MVYAHTNILHKRRLENIVENVKIFLKALLYNGLLLSG